MRGRALIEIDAASERLRPFPPPGWGPSRDVPETELARGDATPRVAFVVRDPRGPDTESLPARAMSEAWERASRAVIRVEPYDHGLVRIGGGVREPTVAREEDMPSTLPDRSIEADSNSTERVAAAIAEPRVVSRQRDDDPSTLPDRSDPPRSDVFAPLPAVEAPTPLDRPARFEDKPTELELRVDTPTRTFATPARSALEPSRLEALDPRYRERAAEDTARERARVESMYDSQREFIIVEARTPARAAHIVSIKNELMTTRLFSNREVVLAAHLREKRALNDAPGDRNREDRVMAIALVARDLDDAYREEIGELKEKVVEDLRALPTEKRERIYDDFDSFMASGAGNDSHFCRRELYRALRDESELKAAYVYALALDRQMRSRREPPPVPLVDEELG